MAATLYNAWKRALMDGAADSSINDIPTTGEYCVLVDTAVYTGPPSPQTAATSVYNPVLTTGAPVVGAAQRITSAVTFVGTTDGVFDGADLTFPLVSGASVEALVIYRLNTGSNTTWRLMSFYDTVGGGLPVVPNGGNITVTWNASGIFQLSDREAKYDINRVGEIGPLGLYTYRYKTPDSGLMVGFIAQEVEKIAPEAVFCINGYKHVDYEAALAAAVRRT